MEDKTPLKMAWSGHIPILISGAPIISLERLKVESSNFVDRQAVSSVSIRATKYPLMDVIRVT